MQISRWSDRSDYGEIFKFADIIELTIKDRSTCWQIGFRSLQLRSHAFVHFRHPSTDSGITVWRDATLISVKMSAPTDQYETTYDTPEYMTPCAIAVKGYYPRRQHDCEVNVNDHLCLLKRMDRNYYWVHNKQTKRTGRVPADVLDIIVPLADAEPIGETTNSPSPLTVAPDINATPPSDASPVVQPVVLRPMPARTLPRKKQQEPAAPFPCIDELRRRLSTMTRSRTEQLEASSPTEGVDTESTEQPSPGDDSSHSLPASPNGPPPSQKPALPPKMRRESWNDATFFAAANKDQFRQPENPQPSRNSTLLPPPSPTTPSREVAWVIVENCGTSGDTESRLSVRDGEVLRWINFEEDILNGDTELDNDAFLECEKWTGEGVVLPSDCVRVLRDRRELAGYLSKRPRAEVITEYITASPERLCLRAGELIYLHREMDDGSFYASNKFSQRCVVPLSVLNILTPCETGKRS
ncbi:hypothetical protein SprV_0100219300 [Sparganum proliferum]